jgi:hypothetical protein
MEVGEADATIRGNVGWRATMPTIRDASIEFDMVWDTDDDDIGPLRLAFLNRTSIEFAVMDRPINQSGAQGLRVICMITQFNRNEGLEEVITVSIVAKPTYTTDAPSWLIVP